MCKTNGLHQKGGLNPYSNGIRIELSLASVALILWKSLNPYSNGIRIEHYQVLFQSDSR